MRESGILMPVTSLPSSHGIGTLGRAAYYFIDFLARSGQNVWQILPTGHTGYGDSPYQCFSAFAGNPYWIDLDLLCIAGLLTPSEVEGAGLVDVPGTIDYGNLFENRFALLRKATERIPQNDKALCSFCHEHEDWLPDYALFMSLKEEHGMVSFHEWPEDLRRREPHLLTTARERLSEEIHFWSCLQYFFYQQWFAIKRYAGCKGIKLLGDMPIYVSPDSVDLWVQPELFQADEDRRLTYIAGCPPDKFARTGQRWGNPLYNWEYHQETGFAWWIKRLQNAETLFDMVRIDHFRGFAGYYAIPAECETAEHGSWKPGPGEAFIQQIKEALPQFEILAEDLGHLTRDVHSLLRFSGFPGMKVMQFAFDPFEDSLYLPDRYEENSVAYTGTHDNPTTVEWAQTAPQKEVAFARVYLGRRRSENFVQCFVRSVLESDSKLVIIPIQDWLELGEEARLNTPGVPEGNWRFRITKDALTDKLSARIREIARECDRG